MNYGYDRSDLLWKPERRQLLADRLEALVSQYDVKVKVDGLYDGVRLRGLTRLNRDDLVNIIEIADRVFVEVMT